MASSSVSQEDVENDFELSSRRTRIRTARARTVNPPVNPPRIDSMMTGEADDIVSDVKGDSLGVSFPGDHDASPKPMIRTKEKRPNRSQAIRQPLADHLNRPNHLSKGKQQRDRRKLREKRRSTGVVHLPSTESTGGSTGEDDGDALSMTAETRRNTLQNEQLLQENVPEVNSKTEENVPEEPVAPKPFQSRRTKSPSDLEADDEDTQDFDSNHSCRRPGTPTGETTDELLERAQEENRRLLSLLEERDRKISTLELRITQLQRDIASERDRLRDENAALIRAMASLATN